MTTKVLLLSLVSALIAPSLAWAQVPELPMPTDEHRWLAQFRGEWETTMQASMEPGKPPVECAGKISSRMLGQFWVINEMTGDMLGTTVNGLQTIGFDPQNKKYVGTWVDSAMTHLWKYEGAVDKTGKKLTLEAEGPNMAEPGKMAIYRDSYEFKSADEIILISSMQTPDGQWVDFMTGTARRIK